jgi:hypothetical protein
MADDRRREWAAGRARLRADFERRTATLEREHAAHLAAAEESKRQAAAAWDALAVAQRTYREERDAIEAQLVATREPEIAAFIETMNRELAELPSRLAKAVYDVTPASRAMDRRQKAIDNASSVASRRNAIRAAITAAEKLSLEALDPRTLAGRLQDLRDALPPVEDVLKLAEAARRRDQAAVDAGDAA